MRRILSIALLLIFVLTGNVFAFDYNIMSEGVIKVEGDAKADSLVSITILNHDKKLTDLVIGTQDNDNANENDIFAAYEEIKADEDGKYSANILIGGKSGIYTLITGKEKSTSYDEKTIYFVRESENLTARELLAQGENLGAVISDNKYALGMDFELVYDETKEDIATIFKNSISNVLELEVKEVTKKLNKAAAIAAFSKGKTSLFGKHNSYFDIDKKVSEWLKKSFMTEKVKSDIETNLVKSYTSFSDFEKSLIEQTVLKVVEKGDGYGNVSKVIDDFKDYIPNINMTYVTDKVCGKIVGNKYTSYSLLLDGIKREYDNLIESSNPIKSSGGGSSKGGSVASVAITIPKTEQNVEEVVKPIEKTNTFSDMENHSWAKEAVDKLSKMGVLKGKEDNKFYPQDLVKREEFVKMIMESVKFSDLYGEILFDDVSKDSWYYSYVKNAYLARIINGLSEKSFGSGKNISRQDMAVIICNALSEKGVCIEKGEGVDFNDKDAISDYAKESVELLSSVGVINGDNNKNFNPKANATRAEAAKMIYGILKYIK